MSSAVEQLRFLGSWLTRPKSTGAISPSGPALARQMAAPVDPAGKGPVIELGPGTGPVTGALIARGIAPARLILVETNPDFCALLAQKFPGARIVSGDAYDLGMTLKPHLEAPPAAIVSSLPLLNRPEEDRIGLIVAAFELAEKRAPFVQFTYGLASPVPRAGLPADVSASGSNRIWLNLPPARVWVYRRP